VKRRDLLGLLGAAPVASALAGPVRAEDGSAEPRPLPRIEPRTVQDVLDFLASEVPGGLPRDTVDLVRLGDPRAPLKGIVTAMFPTHEVMRRAVGLGANLVIAHEPVFYNHLDETDWLAGDSVYGAKRRLAQDQKLVIFRFHDGWHRIAGDGILTGVTHALGWERYADAKVPGLFEIPPTTLRDVISRLKNDLELHTVGVVGEPSLSCERVFLAPGAWSGREQMALIEKHRLDVLICGEVREWETPEYVRDAVTQGRKTALLVTGHIASEEPGMKHCAAWLGQRLAGVKVTHVPLKSALQYV
jgi:putative NIF3 family GTP cyclohydrolase 1 type 2